MPLEKIIENISSAFNKQTKIYIFKLQNHESHLEKIIQFTDKPIRTSQYNVI